MTVDYLKHLKSLNKWFDDYERRFERMNPLLHEERERLNEVENTIQHLESLGVSVPTDLAKLHSHLIEKCRNAKSEQELTALADELDKVTVGLTEMVKRSRIIYSKYISKQKPKFDNESQHISLQQLLAYNYLKTSDSLVLQWDPEAEKFYGNAKKDGSIAVIRGAKTEEFDSPSSAATTLAGRLLNGWKYWSRINPDGTHTSLGQIRDEFAQTTAQKTFNLIS